MSKFPPLPAGAFIPQGMSDTPPANMATDRKPPAVLACLGVVQFCSGFGQFHTNHPSKAKRTPYITLSMAEVKRMAVNPPTLPKGSGQWVIYSNVSNEYGRDLKHLMAVGMFSALWADADKVGNLTTEQIHQIAHGITKSETITHSSRSAVESDQRSRVIIPMSHAVNADDHPLLQQILNDKLQAAGITPDRASERLNQVSYLPNRGEFYTHFISGEGVLFNPDVWAGELAALKQHQAEAKIQHEERLALSLVKLNQRKASGAFSPIDAFNEIYSSRDLWVQYGASGSGQRLLSPNSESGAAAITINESTGKWTSRHQSDIELGIGTRSDNSCWGDAFDLYAYFEHGNDRNRAMAAISNELDPIGQASRQDAYRDDRAAEVIASFPVNDLVEELPPVIANGWDSAMSAKPAQFLIDGFLEEDAHGILGGASMTYKSFFAMRMAHSICSGQPFMGKQVYKPGAVVYVCGEGQGAVNRRLKAAVLKLGKPQHPIDVIAMGVSLTSPESMQKLTERLKLVKPVLVIFDTFASLSGGIEENSNSEVGAALNLVRDACRIAGASSMIVHHFGKDAEKGFRGASAFINNVDFAFTATRYGAEDDRNAIVSCVKMKDGEHFSDIMFKSEVIPLGMKEQNGREATSLLATHASGYIPERQLSAAERVLQCLKDLQSQKGGDEIIYIAGHEWQAKASAEGVSNFTRERKKLIDEGRVIQEDKTYRAL